MPIDIEEELLAFDTELTRRAARYIRIKRRTIEGMEQQLRRCREVMECNDPGNARTLFGPALETPAELPACVCLCPSHTEPSRHHALHCPRYFPNI